MPEQMTFPARFILGEKLPHDESRHLEFKEVKSPKPCGSIINAADEYAVAFLNADGGRIYWGVRDSDKAVVGVSLTGEERDRLRRDVAGKLRSITPQIDPGLFEFNLHPIEGASDELHIVELRVPAGRATEPFYTSGHQCFVRLDGASQLLTGPQLTAWIKRRLTAMPHGTGEIVDPGMISLAKRIRQIFSGHGLLPAHLARFLELRKSPFTITLADQQNDATFLRWLDEPKTAWIAQTFGVRREWIDGEDERIFEEQCYDKRPAKFFSDISHHTDALIYEEVPASSEAWFLRHGIEEDWESKGDSRVFVVIRVPLARMSNEVTIYRYISDFEPYGWTKGRTAIQLRAWARLLFVSKGMTCYGREVPYDLGQEIEGNSAFLHDIIESHKGCRHCRDDWHPEDYSLYPEESCEAKPDDFFSPVIEFLRENKLPHEPTRLFQKS